MRFTDILWTDGLLSRSVASKTCSKPTPFENCGETNSFFVKFLFHHSSLSLTSGITNAESQQLLAIFFI